MQERRNCDVMNVQQAHGNVEYYLGHNDDSRLARADSWSRDSHCELSIFEKYKPHPDKFLAGTSRVRKK